MPELFDLVELLVNLPADNLSIGDRGAIVECLDETHFEIEFTNEEGERLPFVLPLPSNLW